MTQEENSETTVTEDEVLDARIVEMARELAAMNDRKMKVLSAKHETRRAECVDLVKKIHETLAAFVRDYPGERASAVEGAIALRAFLAPPSEPTPAKGAKGTGKKNMQKHAVACVAATTVRGAGLSEGPSAFYKALRATPEAALPCGEPHTEERKAWNATLRAIAERLLAESVSA